MKALGPCFFLAIATSSPLLRAQDQPSAAAAGATEPTPPPASANAPGADSPEPVDAPLGVDEAAAETPPAAPPQSGPGALFATSPPPQAPPDEPATPAAPMEPARPTSTNRGHLRLGVRAGLAAPFGWVAKETQHLEVTGIGAGYGLDLTFGVSEEVTVGAYGDLLVLDRLPGCPDCAPLSYGLGLMVRYHLVQGLRFDPWASYGIGAIALGGVEPNGQGSYVGIEWMRLSFGGDWYAFRNLGLGPYLELGAGSFWQAPAGEEPGGVNLRFQMGMRIVIDVPGR